ncbi:hypothetical protein PHET_11248 [Paragonimus heterotremus]|uniref:Uncharacterized protein n=1 Tax=Paragonimus heterotremus TaxID=100268 RepID=A0A8J4T0X4_9TREM|nr:hypothetical protein PHET_11248 [Paragonimus heterotremus]
MILQLMVSIRPFMVHRIPTTMRISLVTFPSILDSVYLHLGRDLRTCS